MSTSHRTETRIFSFLNNSIHTQSEYIDITCDRVKFVELERRLDYERLLCDRFICYINTHEHLFLNSVIYAYDSFIYLM